jgi:hypothetical protein
MISGDTVDYVIPMKNLKQKMAWPTLKIEADPRK